MTDLTDNFLFDPKDLGQTVKSLRTKKGISSTTLCQQADISRDTLYRLEKGEDVNVSSLFKVLAALGLYVALRGPEPPELEQAPAFFLRNLQ